MPTLSDTIQFHGTAGVITEDPGTLSSDRYGLETCTSTYKIRRPLWASLPRIGTLHPIFDHLEMEHREVSFQGQWAVAKCSYAGIDPVLVNTTPIFECTNSTQEEPIATHPDFETFAGTPMAPLNGAVFRHVESGAISYAGMQTPPTSSNGYVFDHFALQVDDQFAPGNFVKNFMAGVQNYLETGLALRMTWCSVTPPSMSATGKIQPPPGAALMPEVPGKNLHQGQPDEPRTWMNVGLSYTQRGSAYLNSMEWRLSGLYGWIEEIYGAAVAASTIGDDEDTPVVPTNIEQTNLE